MTTGDGCSPQGAAERLASAVLADSLLATAAHLSHALRIMALAARNVELMRLCDQVLDKLDGCLQARSQESAGLAMLELQLLLQAGGRVQ